MNEEYQRQVHILNCFITYCFVFICLIFYGVGTCYASEHEMGRWTDYTQVLLEVPGAGAPIGLNKDTYNVAGHFTQVYVLVGNISINKDYIYQFEISTPGSNFTNVNAVLVNQTVSAPGVNQSCNMLGFSDASIGFPKVYFQCPTSFSNGNLVFTLYNINGSNLTSEPQYFKWGYSNFRYYDDVDEIDWGPVTSNANANADRIIANNNSNTNSIMDNYNQKSTQDTRDIVNGSHQDANSIKNNQNANTDRQIDSQKVCNDTFPTSQDYNIDNSFLNSSGNVVSNQSNWVITDYYEVQSLILVNRYTGTNYPSICYYDNDKTLLSCSQLYTLSEGTITLPTNTKYIRYSIAKNNNLPTFKITSCKNGNQALSDNINNLTGALTDSSSVNMDSLGNTAGWLPAGPIDSIINLPLNFLNNLLTALNGSCSPLHIPIPYLDNKYLDIPCINTIFNQINGLPNFWSWVGAICSVMMLYKYLIALYKYYDDLTTMKANFISDFGGAP